MYGKRYGISVIPIVGKIPTMGILILTIIIFSRAISSENATNAIQYAMSNTLKSSMFCKMAFMALLFSLYFLFFSFLASFTFASHKLTFHHDNGVTVGTQALIVLLALLLVKRGGAAAAVIYSPRASARGKKQEMQQKKWQLFWPIHIKFVTL